MIRPLPPLNKTDWITQPESILVVVPTYPSLTYTQELHRWLHRRFPAENVKEDDVREDIETKYNRLFRDLRNIPVENVLLIDNDMKPDHRSDEIFKSAADIVGCMYDTGNPASWAKASHVHSGFMLLRRRVFELLQPPVFTFPRTPDRCAILSCMCGMLNEKATTAGLTIERVGWSEHGKQRSWC